MSEKTTYEIIIEEMKEETKKTQSEAVKRVHTIQNVIKINVKNTI